MPIALDNYNDDIIAVIGDWPTWGPIRVRDAGLFLRTGIARSREDLVADAMKLRDENRELLAENARLRRALEKKGRR